jgi:hypothetical protein
MDRKISFDALTKSGFSFTSPSLYASLFLYNAHLFISLSLPFSFYVYVYVSLQTNSSFEWLYVIGWLLKSRMRKNLLNPFNNSIWDLRWLSSYFGLFVLSLNSCWTNKCNMCQNIYFVCQSFKIKGYLRIEFFSFY